MKHTKMSGYMTVEAAMLMPIVFGIILLSVYATFFLYNHCVLFQSCYLGCLRGQQLKYLSQNEIEHFVELQTKELLNNQIYQYQVNLKADCSLYKIEVSADTYVSNLIKKLDLFEADSFYGERKAEVIKFDPAQTIRKARLIKNAVN